MIAIEPLQRNESLIECVSELYNNVWAKNDNEFLICLKKHTTYKGFQGFVAYEEENIVGFIYGYVSLEEQYYHGLLREQLTEEEAAYWLQDCFEIVELAVHPSARGKKLGQELIRNLLGKVSTKTAVLTTRNDNQSAHVLYRKLGFTVIDDSFMPVNSHHTWFIFGKTLADEVVSSIEI